MWGCRLMANLNLLKQELEERNDEINQTTELFDSFDDDSSLENEELPIGVVVFTIIPTIILILLFI